MPNITQTIKHTIKNWRKPDLQPLNTIQISRSRILHNINLIRTRQPHAAIFPVLKSNAYGHGILQMLEIFKGQDFPYLAVDSFPEYQIITRNSDFQVLVMGETLPANYAHFDPRKAAFAVRSRESLHTLGEMKSKVRIHLFLNTGMNREWIQEADLPAFLAEVKQYPNLEVEGVMSHFHSADTQCPSMHEQIAQFKKMGKLIEDYGFTPKWRHIAASSGVLQIDDVYFTACRPGLLVYGYPSMSAVGTDHCLNREAPFAEDIALASKIEELQPALSLFSHICALQKLSAGQGVSYNHHRKAEQDCVVASVPFGYYEGRMRNMSGKLTYAHDGVALPQIGRICMNLSSCLGNKHMKIGNQMQLISRDAKSPLAVSHIAEQAGTIPYEVLIRLEKGMRREVVE